MQTLRALTLAIMGVIQLVDIPDNDDDLIARIVAFQGGGHRDETKGLVEVLYRRHNGAICARLGALASSSQIDDLAQNAWVRIIEKLPLYKKEKGAFRAWALTIAAHCWYDSVRTKRPFVLVSDADIPDAFAEREEERLRQSEWAQILRDCLAKLNERQRGVISSLVYEQAAYEAVCLKLGITAAEAHRLKHEAKKLLTNCCRRANR
jgi:RNA polymerase sigma factor (sigma-70 family)